MKLQLADGSKIPVSPDAARYLSQTNTGGGSFWTAFPDLLTGAGSILGAITGNTGVTSGGGSTTVWQQQAATCQSQNIQLQSQLASAKSQRTMYGIMGFGLGVIGGVLIGKATGKKRR